MQANRLAERILDATIVPLVRHLRALQKVVRYISQEASVSLSYTHARALRYVQLRNAFLSNGERSRYRRDVREQLVQAFERVDRDVRAFTSPSEGLFLAEAVLSLEPDGDLVECGCYVGASTAKLSLLAAITKRRLLVFDSFEGLPAAAPDEVRDYDVRQSGRPHWQAGLYRGGLDEVRGNIARYGDLGPCHFFPGWFVNTLTGANLTGPVALAFTDVDIPSSVRDCLRGLWPRLVDGGVLFSHDVSFPKALKVFADAEFWRSELGATPPILFGAGFGLCDDAPHLGFCIKGREGDPEYLASLLLYKGLPGGV